MKIKTIIKNSKGFVMLFAVLVSIIVLSVGAAIISISLKQISLSGTGRDSQFSFYSANTGIECALYWDLVGSPDDRRSIFYQQGSESTNFPEFADGTSPQCLGADLQGWNAVSDGVAYTSDFWLYYSGNGNQDPCVQVRVTKDFIIEGEYNTRIDSRGYNRCADGGPVDSSRTSERGLRITY